jgi:hypothetical protein
MATVNDPYIAPISVDLSAPDLRMDIIKGIEHINEMDVAIVNPSTLNPPFDLGDWGMTTTAGLVPPATGNAVPNVFPIWVGNTQSDSQATGNATILEGGGFVYRTNKFVAGSYVLGQNLCVKNLGNGERVPSAAGSNDAVVARVFAINTAAGSMDISVLDR